MLLPVAHSDTQLTRGEGSPRSASRGKTLRARAKGIKGYALTVLRFSWTSPANEGARLRAVLRLFFFEFRGRVLRRRTLVRLGNRSRLWADIHRWESSKIAYSGLPDYPEMSVWRDFLRSGDLFVDVGANVGSYAIWAAELGADVIALEPASDTFGLLAENVALNGYPVKMIQAAAGAVRGTAQFTSGLDCVNRFDPAGSVQATVVTIDWLIQDHFLAGMKVDVEGFEMDVLRGSEKALSEHRIGLIQLEWNKTSMRADGTDRRPLADYLAQYGYELFRPGLGNVLEPVADLGFGADVFARPGHRCLKDSWCDRSEGSQNAIGYD
jgi:FkbM family methyltransferase